MAEDSIDRESQASPAQAASHEQQEADSRHDHREDMVPVAGFRDPTEAQFARGMLEAAGVECLMQGENANALYPGALRVRLQVKLEDEPAARALLSDAEIEDED